MKPNHLIVLAFVLFIGYILTLVYKTLGVKDDLVYEDYYNQEIAYQEVIDQKTHVLQDSVSANCSTTDHEILFSFLDKSGSPANADGVISFLRPSDVALDKTFPFQSKNGTFNILKTELKGGLYLVKIQWNQNGKTYFKEQQLHLN